MRAPLLILGAASAFLGCSSASKQPSSPASMRSATCTSITSHLASFGDVLETSSFDAKRRVVTYAGLLELLLSFEGAAVDLDAELGAMEDVGLGLEANVKNARSALGKGAQFARAERDSIEKHARQIAPLAKETQQAWRALRSACDGNKGPRDCNGVRDAIARFDAAETTEQHERAALALLALKLPTGTIAKSRDRAVAASKAVQAAVRAQSASTGSMPKRWAGVQRDLAVAMNDLASACRDDSPLSAQLVAAARPDPRKLTVLLHVKPPAGVERSLLSLAQSSSDEEERAFYRARAQGAFGSGFFLVKKTEKGNEVLVVTNRHVIELGDRAALELADGTSLGLADVVYASPTHDLAVLRPAGKVVVTEGFAFAQTSAKDQQTVIATGFPGLVGRPSYQTTKGYVSNESFRLDDGSRPLVYVQHTAPIDPGSSGGPLTDESGHVLGVNTLKVAGREAVALAVPSKYVLDTIRVASMVEAHHRSAPARQKAARLACLGFLAELGAAEPRMLVLEQMISNHLVGTLGLDAATALGGEEGFEHLWNTDSVRAMRIATLVKVRSSFLAWGGPSVLEICDDVDAASTQTDRVKYRVLLGNFDTRDLTFRWEHGRWKVDGMSQGALPAKHVPPKPLPFSAPPPGAHPPKKNVTVKGPRRS